MTTIYQTQKSIGNASEEKVINRLEQSKYRILFRASDDEDFPFFDVIAANQKGKTNNIEIKADTYNNDNVAIEYMQSGLESALLLSTADIYIIHKTALNSIYWIYTKDLKNYIKSNNLKGVVCNAGASQCYIVPLSIFDKL